MSTKSKPVTPSSIGAAIVAARTKLGFSQTGLAAQLKISNSHLSLIEHGKRGLTPAMITTLAKVLKLKPSLLITAEQRKAARAWKAMG